MSYLEIILILFQIGDPAYCFDDAGKHFLYSKI
jgi:hypothetical protein